VLTLHEGQLIAGKYRLFHPLAKGGMGSVWLAKHLSLDVPVAIKFMDPRYADLNDLRARFEREAKAAAQLRIPNVVQIYDYGMEEDTPYIAMEFLRGEDFNARLAREGRLPVHDTVAILTQVCKALRRAHDEGIVHRDLKPANVFLMVQDDELLVKVLDFGIAKVLRSETGEDATKTGEVMGSPAYMSPEQVRGAKDIDHRTDLWSLGVITYRALTGLLPFPGTNTGDMFVRICTDQPVAPTKLAPDLDPRVDAFMTKALSKDPSLRFASAKEMSDALAGLDRGGSSKVPFSTATIGTNVDGATNAPVMSNVLTSERRLRKTFARFAAIVGTLAILLLILVAYWVSKHPMTAESMPISPASLGSEVAAANVPQIDSAEVSSTNPMLTASAQAAVAPIPSASSSSLPQSGPRKTAAPSAPKASANYQLRKEL